jgi:hypothetical protein
MWGFDHGNKLRTALRAFCKVMIEGGPSNGAKLFRIRD